MYNKKLNDIYISGLDLSIKDYSNDTIEFNKNYGGDIKLFYEKIESLYSDFLEDNEISKSNSIIYSCSTTLIDVPYFIQYKMGDSGFEGFLNFGK